MSVYAISDLHLSFATDKPMNVFRGWDNHTERIEANWRRLVKENDTVILPGDLSWALKLEEAVEDFRFINSLPGKKIILKGNHDFWWSTVKKIKAFLEENNFDTIDILFNNSFNFEDFFVCGSRGWVYDGSGEVDEKIIRRECGRLELSINSAKKFAEENKIPINEIVVFLHYPPVYRDYVCEPIIDILKKHEIKRIYYGHIHGSGKIYAPSEFENIEMRLISCDCVDFTPVFIG